MDVIVLISVGFFCEFSSVISEMFLERHASPGAIQRHSTASSRRRIRVAIASHSRRIHVALWSLYQPPHPSPPPSPGGFGGPLRGLGGPFWKPQGLQDGRQDRRITLAIVMRHFAVHFYFEFELQGSIWAPMRGPKGFQKFKFALKSARKSDV